MALRYVSRFTWTIIGAAMVVAVIAVGLFIYGSFNFGQPYSNNSNEPVVVFTVLEGDTMKPVAARLQQQMLIRSAFWMETVARFKGKGSGLQAGEHLLKANMGYDEILDVLTTPKPFASAKFTILPGYRIGQMPDKLRQDGVTNIDNGRFTQIALNGKAGDDYDLYPWLAGRNNDQSLEGYLLPETYEVSIQPTSTIKVGNTLMTPTPTSEQATPEKTIINMMLKQFDTAVTKNDLINVAQQHGHKDFHEVVIVASLVEREAQVKEERAKIASVYWNRLKLNMLMNADPTIQYALGRAGDWWPKLNGGLDQMDDLNGYNTYTVRGLPPTAIASPSEDSLIAAAAPDDTKYLYFVLNCEKNGTHDFSETLAQHNAKVEKYSVCNGSQ